MLGINEIKTGKNITLDGDPYVVLYHEHSKTGRAGAVLRTKIKNLATGAVLEKTFQGADKIGDADITKSKAQYLYREGKNFCFMDSESYDQFSLPEEVLNSMAQYLVEGTEVTILNFDGNPINIEIPVKMTFRVMEAPPGIKGNTASAGDKVVILETGMKLTTPLFVKEGDQVVVNTEKGEYVSRA
jgi:elongation factor P